MGESQKPCNPPKEQQQQVDWIKHVDRLLRPEENMSTGWCGSSNSARHARDEQCTARPSSRLDHQTCRLDETRLEKPVDWFLAESSADKP